MPRKYQFLNRTIPAAVKPENKPLYFTDSGRKLLKTSQSGARAREDVVVRCGYFVYVVNPEKFYREFEEANS